MWQRLLDLLAATRRPLVFVDFETSDLGGAPPVEYAVAYWAPWVPPAEDPLSRATRLRCPPGLTYAGTERLNPMAPINPRAQAIHGITAEMVKGCKRYDDLEVRSFFLGLATGCPGEGPDDPPELGAVWGGHNIAEADLPWARTWGYLPEAAAPTIDTQRIFRRLHKDHPFPLAPDLLPDAMRKVPCIGHGLTPYASSLIGAHTALYGDPHDGGHEALADVCASANVFAGLLSLWQPLWPGPVIGEDPHAALDALLAAINAPPSGQLSWDGWVGVAEDGALSWGPKARKVGEGKSLTCDPGYARWVIGLPPLPTGRNGEAWCSDATRQTLQDALAGVIPPAPARKIGQRGDMTRTP